MRKHLSTILLSVILLAGLSLLLYPTFSDWWNSFHQSRAIASYDKTVAEMDPAQFDAIFAEADAYNQSLWTEADRYQPTDEEHARYLETLDITGTGIMGYIQVPCIGISFPIYHGTDEAILQIAIGHIEGTSLPVGGEGTHCVLSGHRGLPSARLFTDLDQVGEGDIFILQVLDRKMTYQVDQIRIVLPQELNEIELTEGQDYCTLVTCTPYGVNSHRMLVRGHRIENLPEDAELQVGSEAKVIDPNIVAVCVGAPILLILLLAVLLRGSGPKAKPKVKKSSNGEEPQ